MPKADNASRASKVGCARLCGVNEGTAHKVRGHSASRLQDTTADCDQLLSVWLEINNRALWPHFNILTLSPHLPSVIFYVLSLFALCEVCGLLEVQNPQIILNYNS